MKRFCVVFSLLLAAAGLGGCKVDEAKPVDEAKLCAEAACAANATCDASSGQAVCTCAAGFTGDGKSCADVDECAAGTATCHALASCTNTPGTFTCACDPGFSGDGVSCAAEGRVLLLTETASGGATTSLADDAAAALGISVTQVGTAERFTHALDAAGGKVELVVVDTQSVALAEAVQSRLESWVGGGGRLLVSHGALTQLPALQALLGVQATAYEGWRSVWPATAGFIDLFAQHHALTAPLGAQDVPAGAGAQLSLAGPGLMLGVLDTDSSTEGAMTATHDLRVVTFGFRPGDVAAVDADTDGVADAQELYANALLFLLNPRVLTHDDAASASGGMAAEAVHRLRMTAIRTEAAEDFATAFDRGGFEFILYDSAWNSLEDTTESRLTRWVEAGGRLVFGTWDLESHPALATTLGVSTVSFDGMRPLVREPDAPANAFALRAEVPSPMLPAAEDDIGDNGDELTLLGAGSLLARFGSTTGPGAIALTRGGRVVVNGAMPFDYRGVDGDADGTVDAVELYMNELAIVGAP